MQTHILIISAVPALLVAFSIYKFLKKTSILEPEKEVEYIHKDDSYGQELYEKEKIKPLGLEVKNKVELSWQFLYDITDIVINKFSISDRDLVGQIGKKLFNAGARYNHVVEYGINYRKVGISLNKNNTQNISK